MHSQIHLELPPEDDSLIPNAKTYLAKCFSPLTSIANIASHLQLISDRQFYTNLVTPIFIHRLSFIHSFYTVNFPKETALPLLAQHLCDIYSSVFPDEPADAPARPCKYNELKLMFLTALFIVSNSAHNEYATMIVLVLRELKQQHYHQLVSFLTEYVAKLPRVCAVKEELVNMLMICEFESEVIAKVKAVVDEQEKERTKKKLKSTLIERSNGNKDVNKDNKAFKKVNFSLSSTATYDKQQDHALTRGINSRLSAFAQRLQTCNVVVERKNRNDKRSNNTNVSSNSNKTLSIIETFMEKCAELSKTKAAHSSNASNANNSVASNHKPSTKSKLRSIVSNNFYNSNNANTSIGSKYLPKNNIATYSRNEPNENSSLNSQYMILHHRKGRSLMHHHSHTKNNKHTLKRNSSDNDVVLAYKTPPKPSAALPLPSSTSVTAVTLSVAKKNYYHLLNQQIAK